MRTTTQSHPRGRAVYRYAARHVGVIAIIVTACVLLIVAARVLASDSFVPRVHVDNGSEYGVNVRVTDGSVDGWTPLGTAQPNRSTTFEEVYDEGRTWVFEFGYGGFNQSTSMSRTELEHAGWRVQVPAELIRELHRARIPATPVFNGP